MKRFLQLVSECLTDVRELMPWDLEERLASNSDLLVIDVREPYSFYLGCVQMVVREGKELIGVADPRRDGAAAGCAK